MKPPFIHRLRRSQCVRHRERGVTMVLVAVAMIALFAGAALWMDLSPLYLARKEAQRAAAAAALTAARVLSLSGVTGDPSNTQGSLPSAPWPTACGLAQQMATAVANQNSVGRTASTSVVVTFLYNGATTDCTAPSGGFAVNPQVQVQVIRQDLPAFFSRIWSRGANSVSATAVAEAYNSSGSGSLSSLMVPVNPRCVKPWILPNLDPGNSSNHFVDPTDGHIVNQGISLNSFLNAPAATGVIGETFTITACEADGNCENVAGGLPAVGVYIPCLVHAYSTSVSTSVN